MSDSFGSSISAFFCETAKIYFSGVLSANSTAAMDFSRSTESGSDIPGNITTSRMATAGTTVGSESVVLFISSVICPPFYWVNRLKKRRWYKSPAA